MSFYKVTADAAIEIDRGRVVVVIPVYGGYEYVVESVTATLEHTSPEVPICVINDASNDPRIDRFMRELRESPGLKHELYYIEHEVNLGFVESCNEASKRFSPADIVILNSDCVVSAGWLDRMRAAGSSDARIATVSVLANSASILSVPERNQPTEGLPAGLDLKQASELVGKAATGIRPTLPTAIGHCLLIYRSALDLVGGFDPIFSPGYGEEVDFSQRCLISGLKHVLADDVYVLHHGGSSFGQGRTAIQRDHDQITYDRYEWYRPLVHDYSVRTDGPLDRSLLAASVALRRLRVTVDGACLNAAHTGTQLHTLGVISALAASGEVDLRVLVPTPLNSDVAAQIAGFGSAELLPIDDIDDETELSDIVHRPFQVTRPTDLEFLKRLGHRVVVSQLDQIAFHNPSYFDTASEWLEYRQTTVDALGSVDLAVFISQYSADDAISGGLVGADHSAVIHLGVDGLTSDAPDSPERPVDLLDLGGRPFLLCLGTNFSHKNRIFAIALLAEFLAQGWDGWLIFAGPHANSGTSEDGERAALAADLDTAERVLDLGSVEEAQKSWLLQESAAVVYPTTYEGFGLVPFEAAAAGVPCIFASHTSLAELFPAHSATITPWDANATAKRALGLLSPGPQRDAHVTSIVEAGRDLTWANYGQQLLLAYEQALSRPSPAYSRITRSSQGAVSREGYWLVGPNGLLDTRYERPLLAIASRPLLAIIFLRPLEWGYKIAYRIGRWLRPR